MIRDYIHPEERFFEESMELMKNLRKEYKFVKKELTKEKAANRGRMQLWKDVLENEMPSTAEGSVLVSDLDTSEVKPNKMFEDNEDDD